MPILNITNKRYVIIASGEGAAAQLIPVDDYLPQAIHNFMCCCKLPWQQCTQDTGIARAITLLDNEDEWALDDEGQPFCLLLDEYETGRTILYVLKEAS